MKKAMIAMSGGVDSSVAAYLIKSAGYECIGATMRLFDNEDAGISNEKTCCSLDDVEDARSVAYKINIPYYVFNFTADFKREVIDRFINSYESGSTPNPCIDCNRYIKWKKLFLRMKELGLDFVVTGHYARIEKNEQNGRYLLKKGKDSGKDQSYVLYNMTQEQLSHTLLPIGEYSKSDVRKIAEENGFINAKKHDSQDICFVPDGDYAAFIERYTGKTFESGDFVNADGEVLGKHKGLIHYTVGQRKGLGLALKKPQYVCRKDLKANTVILGDNSDLFTREFIASDFNWIMFDQPQKPFTANVKTRYSQSEQPATVTPLGNGDVRIVFDTPQRAITAGQAAVAYIGDTVVGGGTITKTQYNI